MSHDYEGLKKRVDKLDTGSGCLAWAILLCVAVLGAVWSYAIKDLQNRVEKIESQMEAKP